eukprot:TRINITY_DN9052_c0_g2_i1.p1 TRINITY_DN9052_c0_g2~~TRINITY_DN9052_c0_g2_i1.p1  ORF type:complete len:1203 (+),score=231.24 TRINITY_DN9052_c0_g2_i1:243-3611(+)
MVHDGLLGEEGSSQILDFVVEGLTDEKLKELRNLQQLDHSMTDLCSILQLVSSEMFRGPLHRTHSIVHEAGLAPEHAPEPLEQEASYWLGNFVQSKLMVLLCLGPVRGTLQLQPFDEELEAFEISTIPGSFIVLRADAMFHRHFAHSKAHIMSCFLVDGRNPNKKSGWRAPARGDEVPPNATELEQWVLNRMRQLKEEETNTKKKLGIPAGWITAMNHMFHTGQRVAVRSGSARYASSWNVENWSASQLTGVDLVTQVPLTRWDESQYYDADPDGWKNQKTFSHHGSFVDGLEFFDNKFFGLSNMEAAGMDPHQRVVLEVGYETLHRAGYTKGKLMNSLGGVYLGGSNTTFAFVGQAGGATGAAASINSNRFSFCLGLKGPSMTVDTDGSSSLTTVHMGGEAVLEKGMGVSNDYSLSGGVSFQLSPIWLPQYQSAGLLSQVGRCLTWDASADGYALGDGCGFVCLKRLADWVDGQQVYIEGEPLIGTVCGSTCNSNGLGASMTAAHGPSEQELLTQTLRTAMLDPLNIDAVEVNGQGQALGDAVEVDACLRVLRGEENPAALPLTSVKSRSGYAVECSGIMAFHRTLMAGAVGMMTPNCHLQQLNPYLDFDNKANLLTECLDYALQSTYAGVSARGFGGTNVHIITNSQMNTVKPPEPAEGETKRELFQFWPGGGGELDEDKQPVRGYHIAGTWSRWRAVRMEHEGDENYGYTITLGENRWEEFQIYLDGDKEKRLHPGRPLGPKGAPVFGPDSFAKDMNWRIEGRGRWMELPAEAAQNVCIEGNPEKMGKAITALSDCLNGSKSSGSLSLMDGSSDGARLGLEIGSPDVGEPGDRYRIRLRIAGKYRTVFWEKYPKDDDDDLGPVREGEYAVVANWNGWEPEAMSQQDDQWHLEMTLPIDGGQFQILRDDDWCQAICPGRPQAPASEPGQGPEAASETKGCYWHLDGKRGDVFRITFHRHRTIEANSRPEDVKRISWEKLREGAPVEEFRRPPLAVLGSWAGFARMQPMKQVNQPNGQCLYSFQVQLGLQGVEAFQLVQDFDWNAVVHPDRTVTAPESHYQTTVSAADRITDGKVWAIGLDGACSPGDIYQIQVLASGTLVVKVSWSQASGEVKRHELLNS